MRDRPVPTEKIRVFTARRRGRRGAVDACPGCSAAAGRGSAAGSRGMRGAIVGRRRGVLVPWRLSSMANIASQKKRNLRTERERLENRRYTTRIKTYFRRLEGAVQGQDDGAADSEYRELVSTIDKAVKAGALHRNTGARKKSRAARVRAGAAAGV